MVMPLGLAFGSLAAIQTALGALSRIEEIVQLPDEEASDPRKAPGPAASHRLEFRDVEFAYDTRPVLRGFSMTAEPGDMTALVGPSGAGKSTTFSLLERFYDPRSGSILLSGTDVRDYSRSSIRALISYVAQDAPVLAGTLRDNLTMGEVDASDEECWSALDRVRLSTWARSHRLGLDMEVGDGGTLLSGGERQRLAIGRALVSQRQVLLLDEPTSSLDSRNEHALQEVLQDVAQDRTLVIIAHRLATVLAARRIFVVDDGVVVGSGDHESLMASSPLYAELASHQLLGARP
ncbi:Multidrug resistance ABC transporter ATP-binding and permease protein [Clavibacter michiganensis]|nr:Multidrug resistance ABC transporter ATP-binding and permease protein [Clavibacter michiganensis]